MTRAALNAAEHSKAESEIVRQLYPNEGKLALVLLALE